MSGRIRSIKPEILEDAVTAGLSDMGFRLFIACITLADDYGRLRAEPGWIMGQVFWARTVRSEDFAAAWAELEPLVLTYLVNGQRYAEVRNWSKHQKVSHPGKPRVPAPPETLRRVSGDPSEGLVPDLRSPIPIPIGTTDHRPTARALAGPADGPEAVPPWFAAAAEAVRTAAGLPVDDLAARWLEYSAARERKGWAMNQRDAMGWITAVVRGEKTRARERAAAPLRPRDIVQQLGDMEIPEGMR